MPARQKEAHCFSRCITCSSVNNGFLIVLRPLHRRAFHAGTLILFKSSWVGGHQPIEPAIMLLIGHGIKVLSKKLCFY